MPRVRKTTAVTKAISAALMANSYRDDLGIKIRELFEDGASEALEEGRSPSERFELARVRVTIEVVSG